MPRQIVQTQIRLLLKKQSDQGLPCLVFWQAFLNSDPNSQHFIWERELEKCSKFWNIYRIFKLATSSLTGIFLANFGDDWPPLIYIWNLQLNSSKFQGYFYILVKIFHEK